MKIALDHTWAWFTLHANQRMQLVNYFIVSAGFITAGYATSVGARQHLLAGAIATAGALLSVAYNRLESRTRQLVQIAEPALVQLEQWLEDETTIAELGFVAQSERPTKRLSTYGFVIRWVTGLGAAAFLGGAAYQFGYPW